ncbi:mast cell protease 1A-like [Suncus etruscus]|uniref:mast cell protease 1A-like n=1 Tax=Suncus etruscus TaxID=109475 RepID=UPI0021105872|nr:mast cell protease 1A-like [Suncus etruscus]
MLLLLLLSFALSVRAEAGEIIGGHEAKPHSRPYMAFLRYIKKDTNKTMRCGGFLIQNNVVLTAAHCNGRNFKVKLGAHNIIKKEKKSKECTVCATFPHEDYNNDTDFNDIMLLKLCKKVKLTKEINTLSLPDPQTKLKPGQQCSVAGWGRIDINNTLSDKLMEVELKIQEDRECELNFGDYDPTMQLCAGNYEEEDAMKGSKVAQTAPSGRPYLRLPQTFELLVNSSCWSQLASHSLLYSCVSTNLCLHMGHACQQRLVPILN